MARPRTDDEDGVSLFPFLSVLACVVGVLTLMITALALGQMNTGELASAEEFERVNKQLQNVARELSKIEARTASIDERHKDLLARRAELDVLQAQLDKLQESMPPPAAAGDLEPRRADIDKLAEELAARRKDVAALEAELAARPEPSQGAVVEVRPGGTGVDILPTFVECRSDSIVLYEQEPPLRVSKAEIPSHEAFLKLLDAVAANEKRSVIFLIRSDGIDVYQSASDVARKHFARNGKLPVIGQGALDLSAFGG